MTDFHEAAFNMLREDLDKLDLDHMRGCVRCSPEHTCGWAMGVAAAYRRMEERLSPNRLPFPYLRRQIDKAVLSPSSLGDE